MLTLSLYAVTTVTSSYLS